MVTHRLLQPLAEERAAVETLTAYRTGTELAGALLRIRAAVDRVLRLLLRSDSGAPDEVRLRAMSADQLPFDDLIASLRRRDLITLELAGLVHGLEEAAARAHDGTARAADADTALAVVERLSGELGSDAVPSDHGPERPMAVDATGPEPVATREPRRGRQRYWVGVLAVAVALVAWLFGVRPRLQSARAVQAFREGRWVEAERLFGERLAKSDDATSMLYLARMYRMGERYEEAAEMLRRGAAVAPGDADIRRELGYLFLDLGRPESAVEQFRLAQELDPGESLNWIGLIRALTEAGSPEAEEWLRRAPADVRASLGIDSVPG